MMCVCILNGIINVHLSIAAPVRIGFDPADYAVNERDGTVEICVSVLEPNDTSQLDPSFQVSLLFSLESGSALGKNDMYTQLIITILYLLSSW